MYEGRTAAQPGIVFGHENMGIVDEVAPGVTVRPPVTSVKLSFSFISALEERRSSSHALQRCLRPLPQLRRGQIRILYRGEPRICESMTHTFLSYIVLIHRIVFVGRRVSFRAVLERNDPNCS